MESKRNVIVTGSAQGIGYAIAEKFAQQGDQPIIVDLNSEKAQQSAQNLANKYGCQVAAYDTNVANVEEVENLIQQVMEDHGRIDILVNNAGLQHIDPVEDFPVEKWDLLIGVMLRAPFLLTKYAIPHMKEQQYGRIINISSVQGQSASAYKAAYVSAKHGVIGLTRTVSMEVADDNITVNAVLPGTVHTTLIENQLQNLADEDGISREEALQKHLLARQSLKRFIKPEEVAGCCYFLSTDEASAITGETLSVSGGWKG
jgi:3-hydroxybutyrate dehydrogenase